jgi:peptide/nickel transport system substrate-binding protein
MCHPLLFLGLAWPNENGELEGRLARSWEHSPDYRTWTIHLRTGIRWHDGVPVTGDDIEFTYDLWRHPEVLFEDGAGVQDVTVVDDSTVTIVYSNIPRGISFGLPFRGTRVLPKHLLEDLDPSDFHQWEFWDRPVGNGPYRFVRHVPGTMTLLEANPDYFWGKPNIDEVAFKYGPYSMTELLSGEIDALNLDQKADVRLIEDDPRFRVYYEIWDDVGAIQAVLWNQRHPALADVSVRRALTMATDRNALRGLLYRSPAVPIVDVPYSEGQYWRGELPDPIPYDPDQAARLLEEAGWRDRNGDGVRERDGQELTFTVLVWDEWRRAAVFLQDQYARVGARMEIDLMDWRVGIPRVRAGDFEAAIAYFWGMIPERERGLIPMFGEESLLGWRNPEVIELVHRLATLTDPREVDDVYTQLQLHFLRDVPYTYLTLAVETYVAHRRVKGLSTPFRANAYWYVEHLWIDDGS